MRRANNFSFPDDRFRSKSRRAKRESRALGSSLARARARVPFSRRGLSLSVFGDLWLSLAEIYLWKFAGRKDRKETPWYPAFAHSHTSNHTHTVRDWIQFGIAYGDSYICMHIYMYTLRSQSAIQLISILRLLQLKRLSLPPVPRSTFPC